MNWSKEEVIRRLNKLDKRELLSLKRLIFNNMEYPVGFDTEAIEIVAEKLIVRGYVESVAITSLQRFYGHPTFGT